MTHIGGSSGACHDPQCRQGGNQWRSDVLAQSLPNKGLMNHLNHLNMVENKDLAIVKQ
jgi:hypothetical protein